MRIALIVPLSLLTVLTACMSEGEFAARLASIGERADADAVDAHRCAEELRGVAVGDPFVAGTALEMQNWTTRALGAPPTPEAIVARRTREELARREGAVEAARNRIRRVREVGPAALENAIDAGRLARGARDRLCEARDVAMTLAATTNPRRPAVGMTTARSDRR